MLDIYYKRRMPFHLLHKEKRNMKSIDHSRRVVLRWRVVKVDLTCWSWIDLLEVNGVVVVDVVVGVVGVLYEPCSMFFFDVDHSVSI